MSFDGPFGEHQLGGYRVVGDPGRDQLGYLPLARGQRVAGSDGLVQVVDEVFGAAGRAGHVEAARLGGCLPGEHPGLRVVAAGGACSQCAGPVEPDQGDQGPGPEPGVDRHGGGEVAECLLGAAEQRRQPAKRPVRRAGQEDQAGAGGS